jgi:hypothetical protein
MKMFYKARNRRTNSNEDGGKLVGCEVESWDELLEGGSLGVLWIEKSDKYD